MSLIRIEEFPPERAFLISVLRAGFRGVAPPMPSASLSWELVLDEAAYHGLLPRLYRSLDTLAVPSDIRDSIRQSFQETLQRNLLLTGELWRVLEMCKARGILAIPFKGPTLAMAAEGDLAGRVFTDLDLLVAEGELAQVADLLMAAGYEPKMDPRILQDPAFTSVEREFYFHHARRGVLIDLQWHLSSGILPFELSLERIRESAMTVRPGGKEILTLGREDLLLYVCAHGARHCWSELKWIVDVAGLIQAAPGPDWEAVLLRARRMRCERLLFHGILLASELLHAPLPPAIEQAARADAAACELTARIGRLLTQPPGSLMGKLDLHRYFLLLQARPAEKVRHLGRLLFSPTVIDWEFMPLPRRWRFLYPAVRVARLIAERLPKKQHGE